MAGEFYDQEGNSLYYKDQIDNYKQDHYQLHWNQNYLGGWTSNFGLHYTYGRGFYENYNVGYDSSDYIDRRWLDNDFYGFIFSVNQRTTKYNSTIGGSYNKYSGEHYGEYLWIDQDSNSENSYSFKEKFYDDYGNKNEFNVFAKIDYYLNDKLSIYGDLQYRNIKYEAGISANSVFTGYVEEGFSRLDKTFNFFNPKFGLFYNLNDSNNIYFSYARAQREPTRTDYANGSPDAEKLNDFEALLIMRERTKITANLIKNLKKLKYIATSGMRNNSIDLEACKKKKIIVTGTDSNLNPTPELTWALILGLARNLKTEIDNMFQGYWQTTIGVELKGKILGLIGLGRVGSQVAKIGKAFGMEVMAWSENLSLDKCKELDVLPCSKEDLIQNSDFLSVHVQGGERYKDCIKLAEFDKMKKTAYLINTSRGPIVNEDDLIIALSTNQIAGAGIDVYDKEPLPSSHKLRFLPNALLVPHIGYVTAENYSIYYNQMIENLEACLSGKPIRVIE